MKIVQVNTTYNIGSTGRIVAGIENTILESGNDSYVAYGYGKVEDKSHYRIINQWDSYCHNILSRLTDKQGLYTSKKTSSLVQILKNIEPDIVHLHNLHGNYLNYEVLFNYLKNSDAKVIWTLHDCWAFTGHCAYFDLVKCERWKSGCKQCPQIHSYPPAIIDNSQLNYVKKNELFNSLGSRLTLVPVSNWLEGLLKESFLKDTSVQIIHNGINLHNFRHQITTSNPQPYIIGVAFPWDKRKGLADFIRLRRVLSKQINIKLVGLSPEQISSLPEGIQGLSRTSSCEELSNLYSNALAFVNTTYEDNYPTVNMEAIACGTPVITYRTGGSPESVPQLCGYVVDIGDIEAINNHIDILFKTETIFSPTILCEYAKRHFEEQQCFQAYIDLYNSVLK